MRTLKIGAFLLSVSLLLASIARSGDGGLLAKNTSGSAKKPRTTYKSVTDEEDTTRDYFKGAPPPEAHNAYLGMGLDFFDSFGFQGRYAYRLVDRGPIPEINNSLYIEGGMGLTFYGTVAGYSATGVSFLATGRWDFQVNRSWILFGDLGLGLSFVNNDRGSLVKGGGFFPALGAGAMYNFAPQWAARLDLSYQFFGVGILYRF